MPHVLPLASIILPTPLQKRQRRGEQPAWVTLNPCLHQICESSQHLSSCSQYKSVLILNSNFVHIHHLHTMKNMTTLRCHFFEQLIYLFLSERNDPTISYVNTRGLILSSERNHPKISYVNIRGLYLSSVQKDSTISYANIRGLSNAPHNLTMCTI